MARESAREFPSAESRAKKPTERVHYMNRKMNLTLITLALAAGVSTASAQALVWSDNFDDGIPQGWIGASGPAGVGGAAETNYQAVLWGSFNPTPPNAAADTYGCVLHSIPTSGPLPDQQTLEARVDLVAGSRNDAFAQLQLVWPEGPNTHAYALIKDSDEIGLMKAWNGGRALAFLFATNQPLKNVNVTLVLALKRVGSDLQIRTCVLDKDNGNAILFDQTVTDTPQSDPVLPSGSVHGVTTVPDSAGTPWPVVSAPGSVELGLEWLDTNSASGPISVTFDNLAVWQYESPQLTIQKAIALSWPLSQGPGQFVLVSAPSVDGPWAPVPNLWCRTNNAQIEASIQAPESMRFFRLRFAP
jgi:hypothetical protein